MCATSNDDYRYVVRYGRPVTLIDFDLARLTTRLYDMANVLYWWTPLCDLTNHAPAFVLANIPKLAEA